MKIFGITVDENAIADGMIAMLDEDSAERNAIRLGMSPAVLMQVLEKDLGRKFDEIAAAQLNAAPRDVAEFESKMQVEIVNRPKRAEFILAVSRAVHCAILSRGGCLV